MLEEVYIAVNHLVRMILGKPQNEEESCKESSNFLREYNTSVTPNMTLGEIWMAKFILRRS